MNCLKLLAIFIFSFVFFNTEARFISLKAPKVNMRVGPGSKYPIFWIFMKTGIPFQYIAEFEQWLKIKFLDNSEGWVHQNMISNKNTAIIIKDHAILFKTSSRATPIAKIEKNVIARVFKVEKNMAKIEINKIKGWISIDDIWGFNE